MFIFSIFFGLINLVLGMIGSVLGLLFLPFRIVLKLIVRNFVLFLILIGVLLLFRSCTKSSVPSIVQPSVPAPASAAKVNPAAKPGIINPVTRRENGDSSFATDLYASMNDAERSYYSQLFYWAMNTLTDNTGYTWENGNIAGSITPTSRFENKNGDQCRAFSEVLKVHSIEQSLSGIACQRIDGGWCKLKPNATPACGLSSGSNSIFDKIKELF